MSTGADPFVVAPPVGGIPAPWELLRGAGGEPAALQNWGTLTGGMTRTVTGSGGISYEAPALATYEAPIVSVDGAARIRSFGMGYFQGPAVRSPVAFGATLTNWATATSDAAFWSVFGETFTPASRLLPFAGSPFNSLVEVVIEGAIGGVATPRPARFRWSPDGATFYEFGLIVQPWDRIGIVGLNQWISENETVEGV